MDHQDQPTQPQPQPQQQQPQQQQQHQAKDNKLAVELSQYDYIDLAHQRHDQRQLEHVYSQQDVRMKRHPELQPYVPSDRYTTTAVVASAGPANNNKGQAGGGTRTLNNKYGSKFATSSSMTSHPISNSSGQPKKYCSMTRLNQLAQPKKRPASTNNTASSSTTTTTNNNNNSSNSSNTAHTATLSTNSSTRSINSISRSLDKQQQAGSGQKARQRRQPQDTWQPERSVTQSATRPQQQQRADKLDQRLQQHKQQAKNREQDSQRRQSATLTAQDGSLAKRQSETPRQPERRSSSQSQAITPISVAARPGAAIMTPSTPTTLLHPTAPQSSTPVVNSGEPRDKTTAAATPAALQPPTPASSLEEELQSAAQASHAKLNTTRDIVTMHETSSSLAEQVAEISVNDCFYKSAASDLVPDSENSTTTNGIIDYDRNPDSLCREFEQDLIAKGIVSDNDVTDDQFDEFSSPRFSGGSNRDSIRRNSAATIVTSEHSQSEKALRDEEEQQAEDDRRIKAERELREKARLEEEERKQRELLVENIMSRFSQGSVS